MKSTSNKLDEDFFVSSSRAMSLDSNVAVMFETVKTMTSQVFSDNHGLLTSPVPGFPERKYVRWGADDQMPYHLIEQIESDEVLSENKKFNVETCFGQGLRFYDAGTNSPTLNQEVNDFAEENSYHELFAAQCYDMKYFCFSVDVIILNRDATKIVSIVHKPVENIRFELPKNGMDVSVAFYANWRSDAAPLSSVEEIQLLSRNAPWKDLKVRLGQERGDDGEFHKEQMDLRKFGILTMMPIPGSRFYPIPHYASVFKGGWLEIKKLIQINLKYTIKNTQAVRYHVEIHKAFWDKLFQQQGINGNVKKCQEAIQKKHEEIRDFLNAQESKGKTWISEYYVDPMGKENRMVRINLIDTAKQGGQWSDDISEACNMLCYADGIHPNLVGAVPGKTQTNNSGSDKRELFTLKQAIEALPQNLLLKPHKVVLRFNNWWENVRVDVPMITLTTLDTHLDATTVKRDMSNPDV